MEVGMELIKRRRMSQQGIAASQANGRRSRGPVTVEGREQIRAAHTVHGFYSKAEAAALACLGEDAGELERLWQSMYVDLQPEGALEEELVARLVRISWRWRRADRTQEGYALRLAREANNGRENRLHAQMMRMKITAERLQLLARSVEREPYVTPPEDMEAMKKLHEEGVLKEM